MAERKTNSGKGSVPKMSNGEDLARGAVEQLSEDESLRGDLTDDGFSPLLQWASDAAIAYAKTLKPDQTEQMQNYASRLKGVMQSVVVGADAGKIQNFDELLDFELSDKKIALEKLASLKLANDDSDDNAVKITKVLSESLKQ